MNRKNVEDIYPLSPLQEGMLFHGLYSAGKGAYVEQWPLLLEGPLDVDVFHRALQRVVDRHPALRTAFVWENVPRPLQVVFREAAVPLERLDWSEAGEEEWKARLDAFAAERRAAGFALGAAPLLRITLIRLSGPRHLLLFAFHHLLMDGWSAPLVFDEWWQTYDALLRGQPLHLPPAPRFREYIAWLQAQDAGEAERFWRETLRGFTSPTPLPLDRGGPDVAEEHGGEKLLVTGDALARLQALARESAVTLNTVVQGAWGLLLSRYAGTDDVVFGATVSGRPAGLPGVERMVGMFINTLPVRDRIRPEQPVREWLVDLQARQSDARQHEHARLLDVQGWSEAPREHPLFGSLVVFENYPLGPAGDEDDPSTIHMTQLDAPEGTTYPLTLVVMPWPERLELRLNYDVRRFSAVAARRMLGAMESILRAFAGAPDRPLAEVDALPAEDRPLLAAWGAGEPVDGAPSLAHEAFERRAAESPEALAVAWSGGRMTYAALNVRAGALAARLAAAGVRPESAVGVCLPRGAEAVVALLGVLKAGGIYLPLDPSHPPERLRWMLDDARASALVADAAGRAALAGFPGAVVPIEADGAADRAESTPALPHSRTHALSGAYLVYTSGSTGTPKGVVVQHAEAAAHAAAAARVYGLTPRDRVLQFAAPGFDVALEQVLAPLSAGAAVVLRAAEVPGAAELVALLRAEGVTVFNPPTGYWHALASDAEAAAQVRASVRLTLAGGEAMLDEAARRWLDAPGADALLNVYGPTETVVTSAAQAVDPSILGGGATVPVGRPLPGRTAHALDEGMRPVPAGAPGELYVGGLLARGYHGRPGLTAERFVPDAFSTIPGARLYRTGDRARWTEAGALEFLGRADRQVKVRGFRVELGEVEAALLRIPSVRAAAADVRGGALAAYVVASAPIDEDAVAGALRGTLPEHMVPSAILEIDALPLTANGKLDRAALPDPRHASTETAARPETETEIALAALWAELLGADAVGAEDSFFALGGHSLLAMQLVSRVRQAFEVELPLREVFDTTRLRAMAASIDALRDEALAAQLADLDPDELEALLAAAQAGDEG